MGNLKFYIIDVFAPEKYTGNQLAVFILDEKIDTRLMQNIAGEFNFSETTFVYPEPTAPQTFKTHIFTPNAEIPFAGHPTLGTAYIIQEYLLNQHSDTIILDLPAGKIPVTFTYQNEEPNLLWMKQKQPEFGRIITKEEVCPVLQLDQADIHSDHPVQQVSTGLPYFIVPLISLEVVKKAQINPVAYKTFIEKYNPGLTSSHNMTAPAATAFFIFTPETEDARNNLHTRMFDPWYAVPEDAATGSANGCLLAYLLKHRFYQSNELELRVEQGYEMNRPSLIKSKGRERANGEIDINVGGKVQFIAEGYWKI